jgi:hypothetical protein
MEAQNAYQSLDVMRYSLDCRVSMNTVKQHAGYIVSSLARFENLGQENVAEVSPVMAGVTHRRHFVELEQAMKTVRMTGILAIWNDEWRCNSICQVYRQCLAVIYIRCWRVSV